MRRGLRTEVQNTDTVSRYAQSAARTRCRVHQVDDHFLGDGREVPDVHPDVDHAALPAPLLVDVPVEQPPPVVDRPEPGVALDLLTELRPQAPSVRAGSRPPTGRRFRGTAPAVG